MASTRPQQTAEDPRRVAPVGVRTGLSGLGGIPPAARDPYARVLRAWAADLLALRRRGLDRPGFRRGAWEQAGTLQPAETHARAAA